MRKILYISGTRADFGLMRRTLLAIDQHPDLSLTIAATGMHLMESRGYTIHEIRNEGFEIREVLAVFENDSREAMGKFVGHCIIGLVEVCKDIQPDIMLVLGDRGEMLAAATVGTYLGIPTGHIHGGEVTATVDEAVRHAITKLAHFHLPATEDSAQRILKMGESPDRITVVGAPGIDGIDENLLNRVKLLEQLNLNPDQDLALVIQHPVSEEIAEAGEQIAHTLKAVIAAELQAVVVYPNADAGGNKMIEVIKRYEDHPDIQSFPSLNRHVFLSLMKHAQVMVGNSSAGLIEAPSFRLPVVNMGSRQLGRLRGENVIDVGTNTGEILQGIRYALYDKAFISKLQSSINPYGDGQTAKRVVDYLLNLEINQKILQKHIEY